MLQKSLTLPMLCLMTGAISGCLDIGISEDKLNEIGASIAETAAAKAESMYPSEVVVTSPFEISDAQGETRSNDGSHKRDFIWMREQLRNLRNNRVSLSKVFSHNRLRVTGRDASCFGPQLLYQNHPDGSDSTETAELPRGDLGLWLEVEAEKGNACAAAQLNAKMKGLRYKTFSGLAIFAGMLAQAGKSDEFDNILNTGELDLAEQMNALALEHIVFNEAVIAFDSERDVWSYRVRFDFRHLNADDPQSAAFSMTVKPGEESGLYSGVLNYRVDGRHGDGNCEGKEVEHLGSVAFEKAAENSVLTQARNAVFCGHDGENGFDANGLLDAGYSQDKYADGWAGNFSIFTAIFEPENHAGRFAYSWQAGPRDSHSRIFNITMTGNASADSEAWYGFGDSLVQEDAEYMQIKGFICNWAGPGNQHTLTGKAQRQLMQLKGGTDSLKFEPVASGSNITYAPVNACEYDSDSGGSFVYDRNLDEDLNDESADTNDVGEGELLDFDLVSIDENEFSTPPVAAESTEE